MEKLRKVLDLLPAPADPSLCREFLLGDDNRPQNVSHIPDSKSLGALLESWSIALDGDLSDLIGDLKSGKLDNFKAQLREALFSLEAHGHPCNLPDRVEFPYTKGKGLVEPLLRSLQAFKDAGWFPGEIIAQGQHFFEGEHFEVLLENGFKEKFHQSATQALEGFILPSADTAPAEDIEIVPALPKKQQAIKLLGRQADLVIEWKSKEFAPEDGAEGFIIMERELAPTSKYTEHPEKFERILMRGSQIISPLSRLLFTYDEIIRPGPEWDTAIKFRILDRVTEFVAVSSPTNQKNFIKALWEKPNKETSLRRLNSAALERKATSGDFLFLPVTPALNVRNRDLLKKLYPYIEQECLFYFRSRSRKINKKTEENVKRVKQIQSQYSKEGYTVSKRDVPGKAISKGAIYLDVAEERAPLANDSELAKQAINIRQAASRIKRHPSNRIEKKK